MRTQFVLIFWSKMAGRAGRFVLAPLASRARNILRVMFSREINNINAGIFKKPATGSNWTRNCDVLLGISKTRRQTKFKKRHRLFNASGADFSNLFYPPLSHLQKKLIQVPHFHNLPFPHFIRHFGQQ